MTIIEHLSSLVKFSILMFLFLSGCCGPAKWADNLVSQIECNMSVEEVQKLTNKRIIEMEVPAGWKTHFLRCKNTDVGLGFSNGKLIYVQVSWNQKMMRPAFYQRIDLCTNTMM
jgi:hypothetical protein